MACQTSASSNIFAPLFLLPLTHLIPLGFLAPASIYPWPLPADAAAAFHSPPPLPLLLLFFLAPQ